MTPIDFLLLLLIAGVCGGVAKTLTGTPGGCLTSIAVGFVGALIGTSIARVFSLPPIFVLSLGDTDFPLVWSVLGGVLFVAVLSLVFNGDGRRDR